MKKWILTIACFAVGCFVWGQTQVAFWDFNSTTNDAATGTGVLTPAVGSGNIVLLGGITNSFSAGYSADLNTTDNSGLQTTSYPSSGSPKTAGVQWNVNTTGHSDLKFSVWQRLSNTAANTWVLQYSADVTGAATGGIAVWTDATVYTFTPAPTGTGDTWHERTFDFSAITSLNNNPNAGFRIVSDYDPVSGGYLAARSTSTYGGGGTSRFDLFSIEEAAVVIPDASIAAASNFIILNEDAGVHSIPLTISNGNSSPSKIAVALSVYSDAILDTDFTWVNDTIDIPANTNGIIDFPITIIDDNLSERAEKIIVKLIAGDNMNIDPVNNYQIIYVQDNDYVAPSASNELQLELLTSFSNGAAGSNSAEIVAYDSSNYRLYIANSIGKKLDIVDFSDPSAPSLLNSIDITTYGNINSVTVHNGLVALAIENANAQLNGFVVFLDENGVLINQVEVGAMPDMITFNKDFTKILTANEGEPSSNYSVDPVGSVSIVDLTSGAAALTQADVTTIGFDAYNGQETLLRNQGIRIFSTSASVAQDLEPEYITISEDNTKAYVSIQENNAMAVIDIATATIDTIYALGYSDYSSGNGLDASDQSGAVLITSAPVKGAFMPDAIAYSFINGQGYIFSANEGDSREFGSVVDAKRISSMNLDPVAFPDQHILKNNKLFGRLNGLTYSGDTDGDGDFDEIHVMGGRSFSIWNAATGELVFDSKDLLEQITANHPVFGQLFNASNGTGAATLKNRSDDKGPEPEGVTTAFIGGNHYLFVSMERIGGVMVFNVNDPQNPVYSGYANNRTLNGSGPDLGAEGIIYIDAASSPNGNDILILANEVSSTLSVYQLNTCVSLAGGLITASKTLFCQGDTALLSIEPTQGTTFEWLRDGQVLTNETNDELIVDAAGVYKVFVNSTTHACEATSEGIEINVNTLPSVAATASKTSLCTGESVILTANGAVTYVWNNSVQNGVAFQPVQTTTYEVTGTDINGCTNTDEVTVDVNALPVVSLGNDVTVCQSQTPVTLNAGTHTAYNWSTGATTSSIQVFASGTFSVTVKNAAGCSATDAVQVTVENCLGVDELTNAIGVYPNPVTDQLTIETDGLLLQAVYVYDMQGRIQKEMKAHSTTSLKINLSELPAGIYQIKMITEKGVHHHSVSKL